MEDKIKIICGNCEQEFSITFHSYKTKGHRCSCKNPSKGEQIIREYLTKNNIQFTEQKTFDECKNKSLLPFDFYLIDHDLLIEFDESLHFYKCDVLGGENALERQKINDDIKNKFCLQYNKQLFRISYNHIKMIDSRLETYLNTKNHKILEFSHPELYKDMMTRCGLYYKYILYTTKIIYNMSKKNIRICKTIKPS